MHLFARLALGTLSLTLSLVALAGCGGNPAEDLCNKACECAGGCPDGAIEQCTGPIEKARDAADKAGCGSEYDDYLSCAADELSCSDTNGDFEKYCPDERAALLSCAGAQ